MSKESSRVIYAGSVSEAVAAAARLSLLPVLFVAINPDSEDAFYAGNKASLQRAAGAALQASGLGRIRVQQFACCHPVGVSANEPPSSATLTETTRMMSYPLWIVAIEPVEGSNYSRQATTFLEVVQAVRAAFAVSTIQQVAIGQVKQPK